MCVCDSREREHIPNVIRDLNFLLLSSQQWWYTHSKSRLMRMPNKRHLQTDQHHYQMMVTKNRQCPKLQSRTTIRLMTMMLLKAHVCLSNVCVSQPHDRNKYTMPIEWNTEKLSLRWQQQHIQKLLLSERIKLHIQFVILFYSMTIFQ